MQGPPRPTIGERGGGYLHVAVVLINRDAIFHFGQVGSRGFCRLCFAEVGIVLHTLDAYAQGIGAIGKCSLHSGAKDVVEVFVPPSIAAMVVVIVESGALITHIAATHKREGVFAHTKVQTYITFNVEFAPIFAGGAHLSLHIVAQRVGIFAEQLGSEGKVVESGGFLLQVNVGKCEARKFVLGK